MTKKIMMGGSRKLDGGFWNLVNNVVVLALDAGFHIRTACAKGADAFVIDNALRADGADRLSVFCADIPKPPSAALRAQEAGARVISFAGGDSKIRFVARLAIRSRRSIADCTACIFFLASPDSRGSLNTAAEAALQGIDVFAFCCGFVGPPDAPRDSVGEWHQITLAECPAWQWRPEATQPILV